MPSRPPRLLALANFLLLPLLVATAAEARDFEDTYGRILKAELVSHTGVESKTVKVKKSDGKVIDLPIASLSEKDQAYIREWMKDTPPTVNYAFRFDGTRTTLGRRAVYDLEVTNLTRETIRGVTLKVRSIYESRYHPDGVQYFRYGVRLIGYEQEFKIPGEMKYNETAKFTTTDKFKLIGMLIQAYDVEGELIAEKRIGGTKISRTLWDDGRRKGE